MRPAHARRRPALAEEKTALKKPSQGPRCRVATGGLMDVGNFFLQLHSIPENRKAIEDKYGDELKAYLAEQEAKQDQKNLQELAGQNEQQPSGSLERFNPIILEYSLYFKPYCSIALYFITMSRQTVGHWSAKPCCEIH